MLCSSRHHMNQPSAEQARKNVFILALDDFHLDQYMRISDAERFAFHPLLSPEELMRSTAGPTEETETPQPAPTDDEAPPYPFDAVLKRAITELEQFPGSVDGISGYWDFPISNMVPIIAERFGLHAPSLQSIVTCEHKYWSRLAQREVIPSVVPEASLFDPFRDDARSQIPMDYPFWVKPVKSFSSYLGFRIRNDREFAEAMERMRNEIHIIGKPFGALLRRVDAPEEVAAAGGLAGVAEQIIGGAQCTAEGFVVDGEVTVYGILSSLRGPNRSSFHRYQYPTLLPRRVQQRMISASRAVIRHIGLDWSAFNIEYFYDRQKDQIWLVEINTRISQSHPELFYLVDGAPNTQVPVHLAVGEHPDMPYRKGRYPVAAKFMPRSYEDAIVTRVPTEEDIARVETEFPGTRIWVEVEEGVQLSTLPRQDSYSYELAAIYLGAPHPSQLPARYARVLELLNFQLQPLM